MSTVGSLESFLQNPCIVRRNFLVIVLVNANLFEPVTLVEGFGGGIGDLDMQVYPTDLGIDMGSCGS